MISHSTVGIVASAVFLKRWGMPPQGDANKFLGGRDPYAPYDMESLIIKFTDEYIVFTAH